jgi:Clp amino terminal domain, pathogenicity island component
MWWRVSRVVRAATGDDGTGAVWARLTPDGRTVIDLAFTEARELGHPCLAGEHLLLGLLRHGTSRAAALLRARGLDLDSARAELRRVGPALGSVASPAAALRALGIDTDEVRQRLEVSFGPDALRAAERRVRRRPRWRGGHPRPSVLCVYLLAKRAMEFAARSAADRGDAGIGPQYLLYGVLLDARDPLGTQLSRRSRREQAPLGFVPRPAQPGPAPAPAPGTRYRSSAAGR